MIVNLGGILVGEELEYKERVNIEIDEKFTLTHIGNGYDSSGIDLRGFILIPPLINSHVHTADFSFPEIGIDKTIKELVGDPKSEKYKYLSMFRDKLKEGIKEYLVKSSRYGIIAVVDFREEGVLGLKLAKDVRNKIKYIALGRLDRYDERELVELYKLSDGYGLPDPRYHKLDELAVIRKIFHDKIRAVHFAETKKQYLRDSLDLLIEAYSPTLIVHGTHLTREDFELLKENNIPIVFCPRSNMWFGVGIPKVSLAYDLGVTILYGTDNGSWISPNLWKDLELALMITRIQNPGSNYARKILMSATTEAYKVFQLDLQVGEGRRTMPLLVRGEEILRAKDIYMAIIKRASDNGVYSLGATQNIS